MIGAKAEYLFEHIKNKLTWFHEGSFIALQIQELKFE